jgi:hypothetical protein
VLVSELIFISYCHDDNEKLLFVDTGWVDVFHDTLLNRIKVNAPRDRRPEVWFDKQRIEGNHVLTGAIEQALRRASLLMPVISPSYVSSDWCKIELYSFCDHVQHDARLREHARSHVFKIFKNEIDPERRRALDAIPGLADSPGYAFYAGGREIDPLVDRGQVKEFIERIDALAKSVLATIGALNERNSTGVAIFLGECSADMRPEADRLGRELEMFGHRIVRLPASGFVDEAAYRDALRAVLAGCRLAVIPVGASSGAAPAGFEHVPLVVQFEAAADEATRRPADFTQLSWMLPDAAPADDEQRAFVERLEAGGPHFNRLAVEDFKTRVHDVLAPPPPPLERPASAPAPVDAAALDRRARTVYLICDQRDSKAAIEACVEVLKRHVVVVRSLLESELRELADRYGDDLEAMIRTDHEDNLKTCDGILVYCGQGDQLWLRAKLREIRNAPGYGRTLPFRSRALLVARRDGGRIDGEDLLALDGVNGVSEATLEPFFRELR